VTEIVHERIYSHVQETCKGSFEVEIFAFNVTESCATYCRSVLRIRDVLSRIITFFYPESGSEPFFILDPGSYMKRGKKEKATFFVGSLWFQEHIFIVKNIIHLGSRSWIRKKIIPDPDPRSRG
jgi:hypothetical protein